MYLIFISKNSVDSLEKHNTLFTDVCIIKFFKKFVNIPFGFCVLIYFKHATILFDLCLSEDLDWSLHTPLTNRNYNMFFLAHMILQLQMSHWTLFFSLRSTVGKELQDLERELNQFVSLQFNLFFWKDLLLHIIEKFVLVKKKTRLNYAGCYWYVNSYSYQRIPSMSLCKDQEKCAYIKCFMYKAVQVRFKQDINYKGSVQMGRAVYTWIENNKNLEKTIHVIKKMINYLHYSN